MKVLALDTTTARGSVALLVDGQVAGEVRTVTADGHSRWLLPAVEQLLLQHGFRARDLDGFAVTTGPGSFTGQRVGLATVQGLALGTDRPCVGLSALDVLASLSGVAGPVVALMDAWRSEVYACVYEGGRPLGPARAGALAESRGPRAQAHGLRGRRGPQVSRPDRPSLARRRGCWRSISSSPSPRGAWPHRASAGGRGGDPRACVPSICAARSTACPDREPAPRGRGGDPRRPRGLDRARATELQPSLDPGQLRGRARRRRARPAFSSFGRRRPAPIRNGGSGATAPCRCLPARCTS